MGTEWLSAIAINLISSIFYDIGKAFIKNNKKPMSEKQILEIIDSFHGDIDCVFDKLNQMESNLICVSKQNETIFKLLLLIFDNTNDVAISCSEQGYIIDGNYSLKDLNALAQKCLERYALTLPSIPPKSLSEAVWPIPYNLKGVLLDELENNLYNENL